MAEKSAEAFRTISEVADEIGVPQHVLRFWETKFPAIKPLKRGGNRRYYRPEDVALLGAINRLLYTDGYTIKGVQKLLKEKGPRGLLGHQHRAAEQDDSAPASPLQGSRGLDLFTGSGTPGTGTAGVPKDRLLASLRSIRGRLAEALDPERSSLA